MLLYDCYCCSSSIDIVMDIVLRNVENVNNINNFKKISYPLKFKMAKNMFLFF